MGLAGWRAACCSCGSPAGRNISASGGGEPIMKRGNILSGLLALGVTTCAGWASAEQATPTPAPAVADGHASGLMVQARMQAQGGLLSLGGGPSFVLGYQGPS